MGPDGNVNFFADKPAVTSNTTTGQFLAVWHGLDNGGSPLGNGEQEIFGQLFETGRLSPCSCRATFKGTPCFCCFFVEHILQMRYITATRSAMCSITPRSWETTR